MSSRPQVSVQPCLLVAMVAVFLGLFAALPALAELGGSVASIQNDQVHMQGSRRMIAAESYTVHEIQADTGTIVKEYVSSGGTVFAVAWHGPWLPDMKQLLGSYFERYQTAMESNHVARQGRRPIM